MKDLTPEQRQITDFWERRRQTRKELNEYILGKRGDLLDEDITEAVIIGYNTEGGGK